MEELTSQFTEFMVDPDPRYSQELNEYIQLHNVSVSEIAQSITEMSLISLLIDKGIITLDELGTKMRENVDTWPSLQQLKKNYESLMTLIRYETDADVNDDAMN